jgi:3',5'-cyclic AMP phosphodiesterase CpdA
MKGIDMKIIHISDLHIPSPNFEPVWGNRVIKQINSINPDILVISGDLTMSGYVHEYEMVGEYLKKLKVQNIIVVPGNHDARNEGYKIFEEVFDTRYPMFENEEVVIVGVDSSEPDIDDGRVGREHYHLITEELSMREKITIFLLHHHLIPIPGTGRERDIASDAGDVLELITESKVNFVLSGHKHRPWIWKLEKTHFITAGTATTRRLKGKTYPSFNIIKIEGKKANLLRFNVEDEVVQETLDMYF